VTTRPGPAGARPEDIGDGWPLAAPGEVGLDGDTLGGLEALLAEWPDANVHAVVVARRGKLVFERYFTGKDHRWMQPPAVTRFSPTEKHDVRSISKSVTALLVGIAVGDGSFPPLDASVLDSFPEHAELRTPEKARIDFRHLLTMSAGLAWDEGRPWTDPANNERLLVEAADPYRYALEQPVARPPGELFNYCGGATTLLGGALARAVGQKADAYARDRLFAPLGITDFEWLPFTSHPDPAVFGALRLRPRDLAKVGQLLASDGLWGGARVLPSGWVAESTRPRLNTDGLLYYGYHWWLGRSLHGGRDLAWTGGLGNGGQRLYVVPGLDLVVAVNAAQYGSPLQGTIPHAILNRIVLPAVLG
jgi:CubicO group peptidase (beta-lactamase class C family)